MKTKFKSHFRINYISFYYPFCHWSQFIRSLIQHYNWFTTTSISFTSNHCTHRHRPIVYINPIWDYVGMGILGNTDLSILNWHIVATTLFIHKRTLISHASPLNVFNWNIFKAAFISKGSSKYLIRIAIL